MTSGSLWNDYRDKINDFDDNTWDSKSIEYKAKIVGNTLERPGNSKNHHRLIAADLTKKN